MYYLKNDGVILNFSAILLEIISYYNNEKANFSLLYYCILTDFKALVSVPIATEITNDESQRNNIILNLNQAFLRYINV